MNKTIDGIIICNPPLVTNIWEFLENHLDCNCLIDKRKTINTKQTAVVAFASAKQYNDTLSQYYDNHKEKKHYRIMQGIDSKEVGSID